MDNQKKLFEENKMCAPNNFVADTMKHIRLKEMEEREKDTVKIEYSFFKLGQILVVAALFLIIINIFPAEKIVHGQNSEPFPTHQESIIETTTQKIHDFCDDIIDEIDFSIFEKDK